MTNLHKAKLYGQSPKWSLFKMVKLYSQIDEIDLRPISIRPSSMTDLPKSNYVITLHMELHS